MGAARKLFGTLFFLLFLAAAGAAGYIYYVVKMGNNDLPILGALSESDFWLYFGAAVGAAVVLFILFLLIALVGRKKKDEELAFTAVEPEGVQFEQVDAIAGEAAKPVSVVMGSGLSADAEPEGFALGPKVVVYDLPEVQRAFRSWNQEDDQVTYTFPRTVQAAVYSNDHMDVGGRALKLRTLLAGPSQPGPLPPEHAEPLPVTIQPDDVPEPYRSKLFKGVPSTGKEADGEGFVAKLAEARAAPKKRVPPQRGYYDYSGDVHEVEDIEGIGTIYGEKLRKSGIYTTARLCYEKTQDVADKVGVPAKTVETWKHMSELVKIKGVGPQYAEAMARAGIRGISDLQRRRADTLTTQVNEYLDSLQATVVGTKITEKRVEGWKKNAARMKRVRLQVPEK